MSMSDDVKSDVIAELKALIQETDFQEDTILNAQWNLILASKLIEAAGYEISQKCASEHTLALVHLAADVEVIAKKLSQT